MCSDTWTVFAETAKFASWTAQTFCPGRCRSFSSLGSGALDRENADTPSGLLVGCDDHGDRVACSGLLRGTQ